MTAVAGASAAIHDMPINRDMYSNPKMRPHLKDYYESRYAPIRERIEDMKDAAANGESPGTVSLGDGRTATELSAAQYEAMIPSFETWLELQDRFSVFDMADLSASFVEHARDVFDAAEKAFGPDEPSGIRTVFADGERILGYTDEDGGVVTHDGGSALQAIAERADALGLTGEEKIAYIRRQGEDELSPLYPNLSVIDHDDGATPTRREFAQTWYAERNVDGAYDQAFREAEADLAKAEAWRQQQVRNLNGMRAFLLQAMEESQAE